MVGRWDNNKKIDDAERARYHKQTEQYKELFKKDVRNIAATKPYTHLKDEDVVRDAERMHNLARIPDAEKYQRKKKNKRSKVKRCKCK